MTTPINTERWLKIAVKLRVDRARGPAPHKPLLLLVVTDLVEQGILRQPQLPLSGELPFRFLVYWTVVARRRPQRPDVRLPFFHLHRDGIWPPQDERGHPTTERDRSVVVVLDEEFWDCLCDKEFRARLRRLLIARYFQDPAERAALYGLTDMPVSDDDVAQADAKRYAESCEQGREARFRLAVVPAYNSTCVLTGYRCVTVDAGSIVDAAHIHPFANSRNNDPRNGLALSKNALWLFDQGLWSLTDDYKVMVAKDCFHESGEASFLLRSRANRRIGLPPDRALWPNGDHVTWHRTHVFRSEGGRR